MRILISALLLALALNLAYSDDCTFPDLGYDPRIIDTNYGKIQGLCNKVNLIDPDQPNRVEYTMTWFSVPFAKPPVNELRFKKPQPPKPWTDIRDGTVKSNRCIQTNGASSEDCLYLHIFAPASLYNKTSNEKLPIYIYLHGGAFTMGSGVETNQDANALVSLSNMIVVTINYRLGVLGFLYLEGTELSGNQGFLDQYMALKWVHENAHSFRGDNSRITLGGFSAGSFSASYHLIYPPSWPYFRNILMESGVLLYSTMTFMSLEEADRRAKAVFALNGCGNDTSVILTPNELLACARNIDAKVLATVANNYYRATILGGNMAAMELSPLIGLVQDGVEFNQSIQASFEKGQYKKVNLLLGFSRDEGGLLIALSGLTMGGNYYVNKTRMRDFLKNFYYYFPTYPTQPDPSFYDELMNEYTNPSDPDSKDFFPNVLAMLSEGTFICPMVHLSRVYSQYNKVFTFQFEQTRALVPTSPLGVSHGAQGSYVYAKPFETVSATAYNDDERRFSKKLVKYWSNFIKYNDPNMYDSNDKIFNPYWPSFQTNLSLNIPNADSRYFTNYMIFRINLVASTYDLSHRHCDYWIKYGNFPTSP